MDDGLPEDLTLKSVDSIHEVPAAEWDICAACDPAANPLIRHAFFSALEDSGSADTASGWRPQHIVIQRGDGKVVACAPLYLKNHSYGEYVFDWSWAQAYERAGGRYYPKLQCAVPFTPVTGPRLLTHPQLSHHQDLLRRALVGGMVELADRAQVSSLHITFPTAGECDLMTDCGLLPRVGQQFHWKNEGYGSFDDFLAALSSRKRKNIRKERETAMTSGIEIETLTGKDITSEHWDAFYRFYTSTADRKWGHAYLERGFFDLLSERMGDAVVLIMGRQGPRWVCGAINFRGADTLYGRNWGTIVHLPMLHFEVCYYRAIDFAIANNLTWVEAGAQGQHKIQRGYMPRATYSAHWIADPGFRSAVAQFLDREREGVADDIEALAEFGPFKRSGHSP